MFQLDKYMPLDRLNLQQTPLVLCQCYNQTGTAPNRVHCGPVSVIVTQAQLLADSTGTLTVLKLDRHSPQQIPLVPCQGYNQTGSTPSRFYWYPVRVTIRQTQPLADSTGTLSELQLDSHSPQQIPLVPCQSYNQTGSTPSRFHWYPVSVTIRQAQPLAESTGTLSELQLDRHSPQQIPLVPCKCYHQTRLRAPNCSQGPFTLQTEISKGPVTLSNNAYIMLICQYSLKSIWPPRLPQDVMKYLRNF